MAGPLTIQRVPRGLLSALAMKGTGDFPVEISRTLFVGFDATTEYLQDLARFSFSTTAAVGAAGFFSGAGIVPDNEYWLVTNCSLNVPVLAVGNTNWVASLGYVRKTPNSPQLQTFGPPSIPFILGQTYCMGYSFPVGSVVLRPADYLACQIHNGATATFGANVTMTITADYYRLEF